MRPGRPRLLSWRIVASLPDWDQVRVVAFVPAFVALSGALSARSWSDLLRTSVGALVFFAVSWLLFLAANFAWGPGRRIGR